MSVLIGDSDFIPGENFVDRLVRFVSMKKKQIIRISKRDGSEQITTRAELKRVVTAYYERFEDAMHVLESGLRIQSLGYYYELREKK